MSSKIFNETITENNYGELIGQLVNIFRLSSFDKYILLALKIEKSDCSIQLSVLNNDGDKEEYDTIRMEANSPFFHDFLRELIHRLRENCEITKEDVVNLDDDHFVAFRMITKFNDLVTIDGLSDNEVRFINDNQEVEKVEAPLANNNGSSSLTGLLFMITFLILSFVFVVSIVD